MKVSDFIVGMILVSVTVTIFGFFYADAATNYAQPYDNSTFAAYDKLAALQSQTAQINQTVSELNPTSGISDIIGGFLRSGYSVLKATFTSFNIFTSMGDDAMDKVGSVVPGSGFFTLKTGLLMIGFVIFIFIVVSVLVGRDV